MEEQIGHHAQALADLMKDPHQGLSTWAEAVAEHAQWLVDWWSGKLATKDELERAGLTRGPVER